jgi:hypothetical protein
MAISMEYSDLNQSGDLTEHFVTEVAVLVLEVRKEYW